MEQKEQFERRKKVIYDLICDRMYVPMKLKEMAILLSVPQEQRSDLKSVLDALILEGKVEVTAKGKYRKASARFLQGTFIANLKGYGFVEIEGSENDIFVPEEQTAGALHGDTVQVAVLSASDGARRTGSIVRILEHAVKEVVGTYQKGCGYGFVVPDNRKITSDIFIPKEASRGAVDGHKVIAEITSYGSKGRRPEGRIKEIIGHVSDPGTDILSIVYAYGLPNEFSPKIMSQAERIPETVAPDDLTGRRDLRNVRMVTIDGEDAKDLDDAVSLTFDGTRYHLGVHIADVAHYVRENSPLDGEAYERGTSVYLADRVIPMLPRRLSNGICSLNAGVDRLAMSCLMEIDRKGNVVSHEIAESVIRVDRRMSYNEVQGILEAAKAGTASDDAGAQASPSVQPAGGRDVASMQAFEEEPGEYAALTGMLLQMAELAAVLHAKRKKRGSIDFDLPESKVVLDEEGVPLEIRAYEQTTATNLIEEFMLIANETVAEHFYWQDVPFLYRTHESPDQEKIRSLSSLIANFGYGIKGVSDEIHPKELQKLLARIADTPEETMISRLVLRSMKQARYLPQCTGHFGLAAQYYCHFTSPIRRYPDLQIHRIIKDVLHGRMTEERTEHYEGLLEEAAAHCSRTERRADEAERETIKMKKAEYMKAHIGEEYDAVVSGIVSYGMYAELPNTVEGLIHVSRMYDDHYYYREETHELCGSETGRSFRLGDRIRVRVTDADKVMRTVDFELVEPESE